MTAATVPVKVWLLHAAVILLLAVLQFVLPAYHHGVLARIMVLAVFAMGYNLLYGYVGLLSLGHAMFFSAGLYGAGPQHAASRLGRAGGLRRRRRGRRAAGAGDRPAGAAHHAASPS